MVIIWTLCKRHFNFPQARSRILALPTAGNFFRELFANSLQIQSNKPHLAFQLLTGNRPVGRPASQPFFLKRDNSVHKIPCLISRKPEIQLILTNLVVSLKTSIICACESFSDVLKRGHEMDTNLLIAIITIFGYLTFVTVVLGIIALGNGGWFKSRFRHDDSETSYGVDIGSPEPPKPEQPFSKSKKMRSSSQK